MFIALYSFLMILFLARVGYVMEAKGYGRWSARFVGLLLLVGSFAAGHVIALTILTAYQTDSDVEEMNTPMFLVAFLTPLSTLLVTAFIYWRIILGLKPKTATP